MSDDVNKTSEETATDNTGESNIPAVSKKSRGVFGVGGVGSLAMVGLVLIVVLTVLIVKSQSKEDDVLSFAPADSFFALEVENIDGAAGMLAATPIWKGDGLSKEVIINELASWFGPDGDIIQRFVGNINSVTFIESFVDRKPQKMLVMKVGNTWDIESYFKREYSKVSTPVKFAPSMRGLEITRPDKSVFYLKKLANFVIIAESKELLIRSLAAYKKDQLSLAECNIHFGDGDDGMPRVRLYAAINSFYINYPQKREMIPPKIYNMIAGDSAFLYEATINSNGFVAEGKFIRSEAATYASGSEMQQNSQRGFFGTILWIIFIVVLIVIAIPILFLISTLLLALYFFLIAWWKGELVPVDPPLKDLSSHLKEDLGVKKSEADPVKKDEVVKEPDIPSASEPEASANPSIDSDVEPKE